MPIDPALAARVTLFMLRARVPAGWPLRADAFAFGLDEAPVDADEATRRLVAAPKPLACYAETRGDVLVVQTRLPESCRLPVGEGADIALDFSAERDREELGAEYRRVPVLCLGRDEWHILTLGELEEWRRDYRLVRSFGWGSAPLDEVEAQNDIRWHVPPKALVEARARGVQRVQDYANDSDGRDEYVAITRIEPGTRPSFACEHCGERDARYLVEWLDAEHAPRRYCQRCLDHELEAIDFDQGRDLEKLRFDLSVIQLTGTRAELTARAEALAFEWALRHRPPFVADFITRHRAP